LDILGTVQYGKLLKTLTDNGYKEYISTSRDVDKNAFNAIERCEEATQKNIPLSDSNLYVLGYDWRQSTSLSAEKLRDLVRCVYSRHGKKIALVGHSMGGLVIKQYLFNNSDSATYIKSVSTFNTPYLGAVRAIDILGQVNILV
jgi:cyanophycinase-like exopeptidase